MFAARKTDNVSSAANYIEECFSTYLYTGNGATQTITNGIDLSGKGGLVWLKSRSNTIGHTLFDTNRGANKALFTNADLAEYTYTQVLNSFTSSGFTLGSDLGNTNTYTYASWTFREQAKFFDVVTYTGNFVSGVGGTQTINHNLGSAPGCIFVKSVSTSGYWTVYHRELGSNKYVELNTTNQALTNTNVWNNTSPTSTQFSVGAYTDVNKSGETFVAYLFAHDAGGFGATGTDNVISCGSYTGNGSATGPTVTLGYEPQWVLVKRTDSTSNWTLSDNMRGQPVDGATAILNPNLSDAEASATTAVSPTATGFQVKTSGATYNASGGTYIYIAIRRGPMKTPTSGTSVFSPNAQTGAGTTAGQTLTTSFPVDLEISEGRATNGGAYFLDRLRGGQNYMVSASTAAEVNFTVYNPLISFANNTGILDANYGSTSNAYVAWNFRRAPGFFDVVCYTGTGSATTFNHNLTVVPELMIVKSRNNATNWAVYCAYLGGTNPANRYVLLNSSNGFGGTAVYWNDTAPTSTVFTVGTTAATNTSSYTYVAYLFATVAGVSKVGSYTGNGSSQTINCGFTAGARFILIKRTDSTGDWYVWDTARGIVSGNDPRLSLNSTTAEVTTDDSIDPDNSGFIVNQLAATNINVSSATYIYLAIA